MEYIKCPKCGGETPAILTICRHCGERIVKPQPYQQQKVLKDRHIFVTIWLWFDVIVSLVLTMFFFSHIFSSVGLWHATPEPLLYRIIIFIISLLITVGYIMILCWLKAGFYLLVSIGIIGSFYLALGGVAIEVILFSNIAPLLILYLVLQCTKNGKKCWELLGNHIPKSDEIIRSNRNGFVSFWLYSGAVASLIGLLMCTSLMFVGSFRIEMTRLIFGVLYSIGCFGGYCLLIKGFRFGFYIIAALFVIIGIYSQYMSIVTAIVPILILFAVLQIKKDGKSYWKLLS